MSQKNSCPVQDKVYIYFEPYPDKEIQAGLDLTYKVKSIQKDFTLIKGATRPQPVLWVQFYDKPSFPIAYFNCEASRNLAFTCIRNASPISQILLAHDIYFKEINISRNKAKNIARNYRLGAVISQASKKLYHSIPVTGCTKEEVFVGLFNKSPWTSQDLTVTQLKQLVAGKVFPENIDKHQLASDLSTFINVPNGIHLGGPAFFDILLNN